MISKCPECERIVYVICTICRSNPEHYCIARVESPMSLSKSYGSNITVTTNGVVCDRCFRKKGLRPPLKEILPHRSDCSYLRKILPILPESTVLGLVPTVDY